MKNKIVIVLSLIIVLVAVLSGCKKPDAMGTELYDPNAVGMKVIEGEDSYNVMKQAYKYYQNCSDYKMEIDFVFEAMAVGMELYQNSYQNIIRNGGDYYDYYIVAGKGSFVPAPSGHVFYYLNNGEDYAKYYGDHNRASYKNAVRLNDDKKVVADFSTMQWGKFDANVEADGVKSPIDRVNKLKTNLHQYNWLEEKYLSSNTDRKVYEKNGKYYCTIMINTTAMDDSIAQPEVIKAIEKATGGKYKQFNKDTRMIAELEKVDGSYRFSQFVLMEDYSGTKVVKLEVSQYYWHKFSYDSKSLVIPSWD